MEWTILDGWGTTGTAARRVKGEEKKVPTFAHLAVMTISAGSAQRSRGPDIQRTR